MSRLEKTAAAAMVVSFLLLAGVTTRSFVLSRRPDPATIPLVKIGEAVKLPGVSPGGKAYIRNRPFQPVRILPP